MSKRPLKRSRVVISSSNTDPLPSTSTSDAVRVTCTNNNARLIQARAVRLRARKTRRTSQKSAQSSVTVVLSEEENDEPSRGEVANEVSEQDGWEDEGAAEGESPSEGQNAGDGPKKPVSRPCQDWLPYRAEYLDEMLRHDGLGSHAQLPICSGCGAEDADIKCLDCFAQTLQCVVCTRTRHKHHVLHRIERWNGSYFTKETLQALGVEIQVGHELGDCIMPKLKSTDFEGKISAYDLYQSMLHKTDNLGVSLRSGDDPSAGGVRDRYEQLLPVLRIWRHLKMLKRSGRGHDPLGIESTLQGECAVECPACPHPGKNLPPDWRTKPEWIRWIYALILTVDANFKLSLKEKGIKSDPSLGDGWAHWVPRDEFYEYLSVHGGAVEPNYCDSDLKAVNAAARNTKNYKASGVGACLCGRHGLLRKNGLGSLQIGERYPNMDFIVFCGLVRCILEMLWLSYDIVCQWWRNLAKRVKTLPARMQVDPKIINSAKKVLPKFHEYNHGYSCQTRFSINITRHAGRTNGEDPERLWGYMNSASMSTKEMGEGSREDTLDDFGRFYNFRKITRFGNFYPPKLDDAIEMRETQRNVFIKFNAAFPAAVTRQWEAQVAAWDKDPDNQPNPYVEPAQGKSLAALKLELAQEEAADAARGVLRSQEKSMSAFLCNALDLAEDQQLFILRTKSKETTLQASVKEEKRNTLRLRIARFRETQAIYMPGVAELRHEGRTPAMPSLFDIVHYPPGRPCPKTPSFNSRTSKLPEHECLWLPSAIPAELREHACAPGVIETEKRMQLAIMDDSLADLCRQLRIQSTIRDQRRTNGTSSSQRVSTRTQSVLKRFAEKIERSAVRYRAAYAALSSLDPEGDWKKRLQELKPDDVRSLHRTRDDDDEPRKKKRRKNNNSNHESEGRRQLSWIWLRSGPQGRPRMENLTIEQIGDDIRAEWARTKARADRWDEEVMWLVEEMRRILAYFQWKDRWWRKKQNLREDASPDITRGLNAYAAKQAALVTALGHYFASKWMPIHKKHNIKVEWPIEFIPAASNLE
ncbi:hypothetical protein HWV62_34385 [Athelia sp. TMB]|nr:hypothetical protein HWV62_34385 [Athelia sp. TMB]